MRGIALKCAGMSLERSYRWPVRSIFARRWRARFSRRQARPQVAYLLIEALPSQVVAQVRMPVNVSFVLDRSGSMKGDKIDRVRRATSRAMELLDAPGSRLGGDLRPPHRGADPGRPGRQPARDSGEDQPHSRRRRHQDRPGGREGPARDRQGRAERHPPPGAADRRPDRERERLPAPGRRCRPARRADHRARRRQGLERGSADRHGQPLQRHGRLYRPAR